MKAQRQEKILEIVKEHEIDTQSELTKLLAKAGFDVTQATVSRDIHEMKLTKIAALGGGYKYALPTQHDNIGISRLKRIFWDAFVSMDYAGNMLVIRTFNGMAMAVGAALDAMQLKEIVGCIAGDDVVMCATKSEKDAIDLMEKLKRVMQ
ncbi:MAG: arginine repressor [Defluviitaleaceae bacterium]|nr:arginine repressor [Defluviitaleaceae bacterium]